ncbi:MAG: sigma-70 family RNA polymerase sigma factor [Hydrotalea flava]|uniref:RNA polymerase sigma factor n=1 Tax=unclassified Hydrotalea TaxID=2643788 RepID=UPI000945AE43|nr:MULTISPECIES: sigma-70 family RNA polymerase sigma factor [unclassified Hydrotalea]MBY0347851.1 sigma-70 family RNA polymerase sigma factor [Hydrotalea flava]RWZ88544.1 MAG: sigma-70 family RNA polymerase sigma factor [Hydrotalea sp. AMD]
MLTKDDLIKCLEGCKKNDRRSQEKLYASYYGFAMSICFKYVNNHEEAVEAVHDGFLKIFKELYHFSTDTQIVIPTFTAWLKKIMIFTAIDYYRKQKKEAVFTELDVQHEEVTNVIENGLDKMSHDEIMKAIKTLPPGYRLVFNLYVVDGLSHKEVAAYLNISEGTSKSNLSKARAFLQKILLPHLT